MVPCYASGSASHSSRVRCAEHAERPIKTGEEILISYGDLSDAQLLQTYGFVEEHPGFTNPWNFIAVSHDLVDEVHSLLLDPETPAVMVPEWRPR